MLSICPPQSEAENPGRANETFSAVVARAIRNGNGSGLRHRTAGNGQKLAWSVGDYLRVIERIGASWKLNRRSRPRSAEADTSARAGDKSNAHAVRMTASPILQTAVERALGRHASGPRSLPAELTPREVGTITNVSTGIATVSGLPGVGFEDGVRFPGGTFGIAFNVDAAEVGVVLLGEYQHLQAGDQVRRTGRVMDVGVGEGLLGRVIDPLGGPWMAKGHRYGRAPAGGAAGAAIMDRAPVVAPLQTGIKVIDAMIPIGRGQRELILGDRQTGKTAIAIDSHPQSARPKCGVRLLRDRPACLGQSQRSWPNCARAAPWTTPS